MSSTEEGMEDYSATGSNLEPESQFGLKKPLFRWYVHTFPLCSTCRAYWYLQSPVDIDDRQGRHRFELLMAVLFPFLPYHRKASESDLLLSEGLKRGKTLDQTFLSNERLDSRRRSDSLTSPQQLLLPQT